MVAYYGSLLTYMCWKIINVREYNFITIHLNQISHLTGSIVYNAHLTGIMLTEIMAIYEGWSSLVQTSPLKSVRLKNKFCLRGINKKTFFSLV